MATKLVTDFQGYAISGSSASLTLTITTNEGEGVSLLYKNGSQVDQSTDNKAVFNVTVKKGDKLEVFTKVADIDPSDANNKTGISVEVEGGKKTFKENYSCDADNQETVSYSIIFLIL